MGDPPGGEHDDRAEAVGDLPRRRAGRTLYGVNLQALRFAGLVGLVPLAAGSVHAQAGPLDTGLMHYRAARLDSALPWFDRAVRDSPRHDDAHAWRAETARRLGLVDTAVAAARRALEITACHSFAHTVLADALNPQYSDYPAASLDSTWAHLTRAVQCNPDDGNAWMGLWIQGMSRGDTAIERQALRRLVATGFLTPPVLAYNRWVLDLLPPRTVLITNGDWDTYPAVALQLVEARRPDIAIVNFPMLNLPWYVRLQRDRYGMPLAVTDEVLDAFQPFRDATGQDIYLADVIVRGWRAAAVEERLGRPLAYAATTGGELPRRGVGLVQWAGPYSLITSRVADPDTAAIARALRAADARAFVGRDTSPIDRSAVRQSVETPVGANVLGMAVGYVELLTGRGSTPEAVTVVEWIRTFVAVTGWTDGFTRQVLDWAGQTLAERRPPKE